MKENVGELLSHSLLISNDYEILLHKVNGKFPSLQYSINYKDISDPKPLL
jgi:hypothetical protein